ncbi:MAG: hypothetical protein JRG91_02720 [Deltaproteobacteria bacterium]|nr:hypothetical protein [Deltaproteobacteria bacterium]
MRKITSLAVIALVLCSARMAWGADYYVATDGSNTTGDGSIGAPWATITFASNSGIPVSGGHTIIVRDGEYNGATYLIRGFENPVIIRAEHLYMAKLSNLDYDSTGNITDGSEALQVYIRGEANITIQGFVISNHDPSRSCADDGSERSADLVHFQDVTHLTFRNNIVFGNNAPGTCNDMVKINRGGDAYYPREIHITGNVFYDHPAGSGVDLIDSVRPGELDITGNIFFVRDVDIYAQSFITIKREVTEAGMPEWARPPRDPRYVIARNVFLNWGGKGDQAFLQFGEDGVSDHEITHALVENNLFIGNSPDMIAGAMQFKGVRDVVVRANTIVGDLPGSSYGFRIGTEGSNPTVGEIFIRNNVFCDPEGTMGTRFINTYGDVDVSSFVLDNNLFWNAGASLPAEEPPIPESDANRIVEDPLLETDHGALVLPAWDASSGRFVSGSTTVRQEFERLVLLYGAIPEASPAVGAADASHMPADDILGRTRDSSPDVGAFEYLIDVPDDPPDGVPEAVDGAADPGPDAAGDADLDSPHDVPVDGDGDGTSDPGPDGGDDGDEAKGCGCTLVT